MKLPDHSNSINNETRRQKDRRVSVFVGNIQHNITTQFGYALKQKRTAMGMTQSELANLTGINRSFISEVECGKQNISLERADKLARGVGSNLIELLSTNNSQNGT